MKQFQTRSTSRMTALCDPIVLREGEQVRLVFVPALVDNPSNPKASVDGAFVYQRKARSGRWLPIRTVSLATLKEGDEFKLTLHAQELRNLVEALVPLCKFYEREGIPQGQKTFVEVTPAMKRLVSAGEKDLTKLLESQPDEAASLLLSLVRWLTTSSSRREAAAQLASLAPEQMPALTALLGLVALILNPNPDSNHHRFLILP